MNKCEYFLKKHSTDILTIISSIGVISTAVLAVKATPKAIKIYEKYKQEHEEAETIDICKVTWKPYIPSIVSGLTTITCIFGINYINKQNQKALIAAYLALHKAYLYQKDFIDQIDNRCDEATLSDEQLICTDDKLFFDYQSMRYFESTFDRVKKAEQLFNEYLSRNGVATLNELYELLGIPEVDYGYNLGWSTFDDDRLYTNSGLQFVCELTKLEDDIECWIISFSSQPLPLY